MAFVENTVALFFTPFGYWKPFLKALMEAQYFSLDEHWLKDKQSEFALKETKHENHVELNTGKGLKNSMNCLS